MKFSISRSVKFSAGAALVALFGFAPTVAPTALAEEGRAPAVAIVCLIEGKATTLAAGSNPSVELGLFDRLSAGKTIEVAADGRVVIAFLGGARFELTGPGKGRVTTDRLESIAGKVRPLESVPSLPKIAPIARQERAGSRPGAVRIRGGVGGARTISGLEPRDGETVPSDAVSLNFVPLEGAIRYRVELEDEAGSTLLSVETRGPTVAVPEGVLKPGSVYFWLVRPLDRTGFANRVDAMFQTLGADDAAARGSIAAQAAAANDVSLWLLLSEVDRSLGLRREACRDLGMAREKASDPSSIDGELKAAGCVGK